VCKCTRVCVCVCLRARACVCVRVWLILRYVNAIKQNEMNEECSMQRDDEKVLINFSAKI
jgi:hypothetical protein